MKASFMKYLENSRRSSPLKTAAYREGSEVPYWNLWQIMDTKQPSCDWVYRTRLWNTANNGNCGNFAVMIIRPSPKPPAKLQPAAKQTASQVNLFLQQPFYSNLSLSLDDLLT